MLYDCAIFITSSESVAMATSSMSCTAMAVLMTIGVPPMSANTLFGKRLDPIRAGMIIMM